MCQPNQSSTVWLYHGMCTVKVCHQEVIQRIMLCVVKVCHQSVIKISHKHTVSHTHTHSHSHAHTHNLLFYFSPQEGLADQPEIGQAEMHNRVWACLTSTNSFPRYEVKYKSQRWSLPHRIRFQSVSVHGQKLSFNDTSDFPSDILVSAELKYNVLIQ